MTARAKKNLKRKKEKKKAISRGIPILRVAIHAYTLLQKYCIRGSLDDRPLTYYI
jgi:hypothetical protein